MRQMRFELTRQAADLEERLASEQRRSKRWRAEARRERSGSPRGLGPDGQCDRCRDHAQAQQGWGHRPPEPASLQPQSPMRPHQQQHQRRHLPQERQHLPQEPRGQHAPADVADARPAPFLDLAMDPREARAQLSRRSSSFERRLEVLESRIQSQQPKVASLPATAGPEWQPPAAGPEWLESASLGARGLGPPEACPEPAPAAWEAVLQEEALTSGSQQEHPVLIHWQPSACPWPPTALDGRPAPLAPMAVPWGLQPQPSSCSLMQNSCNNGLVYPAEPVAVGPLPSVVPAGQIPPWPAPVGFRGALHQDWKDETPMPSYSSMQNNCNNGLVSVRGLAAAALAPPPAPVPVAVEVETRPPGAALGDPRLWPPRAAAVALGAAAPAVSILLLCIYVNIINLALL